LPFTGADAATLPLVLALLPLSRAEVEAWVFSDMRLLAGVAAADAFAAADFDDKGRACVLAVAVADISAVFSADAAVFTDALPLPDWGALVDKLSVALAFAIGTLTFASIGKKDFAIQTVYCSTPLLDGFLSGMVFT
jgi:hypothetical protein